MKKKMKKVLLFLAVLAMVAFTACNNNEQSTETKETPIEEFTNEELKDITLQYATREGYDLDGYEEICFGLEPLYNTTEYLIEQSEEFVLKTHTDFLNLKENEQSIFCDKYDLYTSYEIDEVFKRIDEGINKNSQLINDDIEYLNWLCGFITDFYNNLYDNSTLEGFRGLWAYKTTNKDLNKVLVSIPNKANYDPKDINLDTDIAKYFDVDDCNELENIYIYDYATTDEELEGLVISIDKYKEKVENLKSYLVSGK